MPRSRWEEGEEEEEELFNKLLLLLFDVFAFWYLIKIGGKENFGAPRLPATGNAGPVARGMTYFFQPVKEVAFVINSFLYLSKLWD